jgi:hypothetical protein
LSLAEESHLFKIMSTFSRKCTLNDGPIWKFIFLAPLWSIFESHSNTTVPPNSVEAFVVVASIHSLTSLGPFLFLPSLTIAYPEDTKTLSSKLPECTSPPQSQSLGERAYNEDSQSIW